MKNAIAVSFVEDSVWWDPSMSAFMSAWPSVLVAEAERQRTWRSGPGVP